MIEIFYLNPKLNYCVKFNLPTYQNPYEQIKT